MKDMEFGLMDAKNVIIFGLNTSNSSHSTHRTQNILIFYRFFSRNKQHNNLCRKDMQD